MSASFDSINASHQPKPSFNLLKLINKFKDEHFISDEQKYSTLLFTIFFSFFAQSTIQPPHVSYLLSYLLRHKKRKKNLCTVRVSAKILGPIISFYKLRLIMIVKLAARRGISPPVIFKLQLISRAISGSRSLGLGSLGSGPCATDVLIAVS